jgi:hypothetical protein
MRRTVRGGEMGEEKKCKKRRNGREGEMDKEEK